jgi:hypothetical protein
MNKDTLKSMITNIITDKTDAAASDFKSYMQSKSQEVLSVNKPQHEIKSNAETNTEE